MEHELNESLPPVFAKELCNIPEVPDHIFGNVQRTLHRRTMVSRAVWLAAATLVVSVSMIPVMQPKPLEVSSSPEVIDELSSVSTFYNSEEHSSITDADVESVIYQP